LISYLLTVIDAADEDCGVIPRSLLELFDMLESKAASNDRFDFTVSK
jgi:hypothetical protein